MRLQAEGGGGLARGVKTEHKNPSKKNSHERLAVQSRDPPAQQFRWEQAADQVSCQFVEREGEGSLAYPGAHRCFKNSDF